MDVRPLLGVVGGLIALWVTLMILFLALRPRGAPVREILRVVPDVVRLLRALLADPSTPLDVRLILAGLLVWIISPIDLIPEFIPVLGPLDDVVVAVVAMRYARRRIGVQVLRGKWTGTASGFALLLRVIGSGE